MSPKISRRNRTLLAASLLLAGANQALAGTFYSFGDASRIPTEFAKFDPSGESAVLYYGFVLSTYTERACFTDFSVTPISNPSGGGMRPVGADISGKVFTFLPTLGVSGFLPNVAQYQRNQPVTSNTLYTGVTYDGASQWTNDFDFAVSELAPNRFVAKQDQTVRCQLANGSPQSFFPLSGYSTYAPRGINASGQIAVCVNKGSTFLPDAAEVLDFSSGVLNFVSLPAMTDAISISGSGDTVLSRNGTGTWYFNQWRRSQLIALQPGASSRLYPVGMTRDGKLAFGGVDGLGGTLPSTGVVWGPDGTRYNAASLITAQGITLPAGANIRCVTDISSNGKRMIVIYEQGGTLFYGLVDLDYPLVLPSVRYQLRQVSPPGLTNLSFTGVNQKGFTGGVGQTSGFVRGFTEGPASNFNIQPSSLDTVVYSIDDNSNGYGFTGASTATPTFFPASGGNVPAGLTGLGVIVRATPDGSAFVGYAQNAANPSGTAAYWPGTPNQATIERPLGLLVNTEATALSTDGRLIAGAVGTNWRVANRVAAGIYSSFALPGVTRSDGYVYDVGRGSFSGNPIVLGNDAAGPTMWVANANMIASTVFTKFSIPGGDGYIVGGQSYGTSTASLAANTGLSLFGNDSNGAFLFTNDFGRTRVSVLGTDTAAANTTNVSYMSLNGRITGNLVGVVGYAGTPLLPVRGRLVLNGFDLNTKVPNVVGTAYARTFPISLSPREQAPMYVNQEGAFSTTLPFIGKADLIVKFAHYLSEDNWDLNFETSRSVPFQIVPLINGDVDTDDEIGPADLQFVLDYFGQESGWPNGIYPDLDGDGECGPGDLQIVLDNFGRQGVL